MPIIASRSASSARGYGQFENTGIVTNSLILNLDAGNLSSYPGSGTTWTDISSSPTNATLINGPTYSSSNNGYLSFDGSNDYAQVSSSSKFAFGTGDFTLETWIYPQSFSNYLHMIALPEQNTFALKANVSDGQIYFYSPSYTTYGSTSGWTLTLNTWNHVVFKRESSVGYAFLNGVSKGSKSGFTSSFSTQTLNIHNGYGSEFASCRISSVRIYNRALNSNEITQNFNAKKSIFGF
jgi:hypothetical protein